MSRPTPMTPALRDEMLEKLEAQAKAAGFPSHRDGSSVLVIERNTTRHWRVMPLTTNLVQIECVVSDETDTVLTLTMIRFVERMLIARDNDRAREQEARRVG